MEQDKLMRFGAPQSKRWLKTYAFPIEARVYPIKQTNRYYAIDLSLRGA